MEYYLSIEHPEWGHAINTFSNKTEALKEMSYISRNGCSFSHRLSRSERADCTLVLSTDEKGGIAYKSFIKSYINSPIK